MTDWMKSWGNFLTENKEPIEEASEEEIADLDDILLTLDPKDLSFNNIFGDKMRIAIPLDEKSSKSPVEKFLNERGYEVDMKTGIATGYAMTNDDRTNTRKISLDQQEDYVTPEGKINVAKLNQLGFTPARIEKMQRNLRKIQMKVGKLLRKGINFLEKGDEKKYRQFFVDPETDPVQLKLMVYKLKEVLSDWEKRGATKSGHTVIITRHPIDVFRMSDFDRIQSCHSPPSKGGDASYYKCAVAEAHGHGPVAYLVRNEDLDEALEEKELDKGDYQALLDQYEDDEEEFFYDDDRQEGDITPINRLRVRKYSSPKFNMTVAVPAKRVYGDDRGFGDAMVNTVVKWAQESQEDALKKMKDDEDMLSYGRFNMDNWIRHGGTYHQDNSPETLLRQFLDDDRFKNPSDFAGFIQVDATTENSLTLTTGIQAVEEEANDKVDDFNRRSFAVRVTIGDIDAEDGQFYISINEAVLVVKIPEDEFIESAFTDFSRQAIQNIVEYMSDYLPVNKEERVYYTAKDGMVVMDVPLDMESINREGGTLVYGLYGLDEVLAELDRQDDAHEQYEAAAREALMIERGIKGSPLQEFAKMYNDNSYYEWSFEMDDNYNPTDIEIETRQYVNLKDLIKKIPVTLDRNPTPGGLSTLIPVKFDGSEIAEVARVYDAEETKVIGYEVVSQEFEDKKSDPLPNLKAVIAHVQREITKMIVMGGPMKFGGLHDASRDYHIAVREELRKAVGGEEGEYSYPNSSLYVSGPDRDNDYNMQYEIGLSDNSSEGQINAAEKIVNDVDDEDVLIEIFRLAFARVAKVPMTTNENVRNYFKKFDIFG